MKRRHALTLAEVVVSMAVVSVMLAAALNMVGSAASTTQGRSSRDRASALTADLMSEILRCSYEEPYSMNGWGPDADEDDGTRDPFDDIDDYDGWSASPPESSGGTPIDGYDGWTRSVQVTYARLSQPGAVSFSPSGLKRIQVSVTDPQNRQATIVALRADRADDAAETDAVSNRIAAMSIELQLGEATMPVLTGVRLLNEPEGEATVLEPDENSPPEAVALANPDRGIPPLPVTLWGGDSFDPDPGDSLTCTWDLGDGTVASGKMVQHTYWEEGIYKAQLTVTDESGESDVAYVTIQVEAL